MYTYTYKSINTKNLYITQYVFKTWYVMRNISSTLYIFRAENKNISNNLCKNVPVMRRFFVILH